MHQALTIAVRIDNGEHCIFMWRDGNLFHINADHTTRVNPASEWHTGVTIPQCWQPVDA